MYKNIEQQLLIYSDLEKKEFLPHFFKTGKGEYGEGDRFLGVMVPNIRKVAKENFTLSLKEIEKTLHSEYHECRLCAVFILVEKFKKQKKRKKKKRFSISIYPKPYILIIGI